MDYDGKFGGYSSEMIHHSRSTANHQHGGLLRAVSSGNILESEYRDDRGRVGGAQIGFGHF